MWLWALAACNQQQPPREMAARLDVLETQVRQLEQMQAKGANPLGTGAPEPEMGYEISCPAPWQALGKFGEAEWTCRAPQALPSGCGRTST